MSLCLDICRGLGTSPGALTSTNPKCLPGRSTIRSGIPSNPGDTNFGQIPPLAFTARTSFCSTCFSLIFLPCSFKSIHTSAAGSTAFKVSADGFLIPVTRKLPVFFHVSRKVAHRCLRVYVLFHHPCIKVHCDSSINRIPGCRGCRTFPILPIRDFLTEKFSIRDIGISPATPAPFN